MLTLGAPGPKIQQRWSIGVLLQDQSTTLPPERPGKGAAGDSFPLDAAVRAAQKESEKLGILPEQGKDDVASMFDDVYAKVPWHLAEQREQALGESGD